jgi:subtilisin family serine protease
MRLQPLFALALLALAAPAVAGELTPALSARLAQAPADTLISVIATLAEQAPVAALSRQLAAEDASRAQRHREVLTSLRETAARSQAPLRAWLEAQRETGALAGYTPHWIANLVVVAARPGLIAALAARPDVAYVEPNFRASLDEPARGPALPGARSVGVTPGLVAIGADRVWRELGITGEGALVAVIDTGVEASHPALAARWRGLFAPAGECWLDLLGVSPLVPVDPQSHGTHVMGTLAGFAPGDSIGVAPGAQWIATNAIGQGVGTPFNNDVIAAFAWLADPDGDPDTVADVPDVVMNAWGVNETLGYPDCDSRWWAVIDHCEAAGVVALFAAGGDGPAPGSLRSPADRAATALSSFAIGAVDARDPDAWPYPLASFSSRGPSGCEVSPDLAIKPELVAPGVDIVSAVAGGGYASWSGSAMAGPHVAGVVALMRSANPELSVDSIKQILLDTARDAGPAGDDNGYGWGCVDAYAAVQAALADPTAAPDAAPAGVDLLSARPNPFRPRAGDLTLSFALAAPGRVELSIYDVAGRQLRRLAAGRLEAGAHTLGWDGRDERGRPVATGVYLCRLEAGAASRALRFVLLR